MIQPPANNTYIAALWEFPSICIALFGVQFHTEQGQHRYEEAGISVQMNAALDAARDEGLLLNRPLLSPEGPLLLQYWRSYDDLDRWARKQPHSGWWRWLLEHSGPDLGFYHELYQAKSAEAIFERGTQPVGPALFCTLEPVNPGEGRSRQRQQRFLDAASHPSP